MKLRGEHVHKEIARRNRARAGGIRRNDLRIERENGRGIIRTGIGVREAAADGAAITHLHVADLRGGLRKQGTRRSK